MKRGLGLVSLLALATAQAASAQTITTDIRADTDAARSLGTIVTTSGQTRTINGGKLSGTNLFHSFSRFDLGAGDTARWIHTAGNPASISNIINRVTGGNPSDIYGRIDTTAIPNADFYFINPAGIVFGATAKVAVPNAAHFSTAREIGFADNVNFTISTTSGSQFSMADPASFGFVGSRGDVRITGVTSGFLSSGASFSASGRNLEVTNSNFQSGDLRLAAVGAADGRIATSGTLQSFGDGRLNIVGSQVTTAASSTSSGEVSLAGSRITIDRSSIKAQAGARGSPGIQIRSADLSVFRDAQIATLTGATAAGGSIDIRSDRITVSDSALQARTTTAADAGRIDIVATQAVAIQGGSSVDADAMSASTGKAGAVNITAGTLNVRDEGTRISSTARGSGSGSTVAIVADRVDITRGARIASETAAGGDAGQVTVSTAELRINSEGSISTTSFGSGRGGAAQIRAGLIDIANPESGIFATARGSGAGGSILVMADTINMRDNSRIAALTFSSGNSGTIDLTAKNLTLQGDANIRTVTTPESTGHAGNLTVKADNITLLSGGKITTSAFAKGDAGQLKVTAEKILIKDPSSAITSTTFGAGEAGAIAIKADRLEVTDGGFISTEAGAGATGKAGSVLIDARDVSVSNKGLINSSTRADTDAGSVIINADAIAVSSGGSISTTTTLRGRAGTVALTARNLSVDGGTISSESFAGSRGSAGQIALTGENVTLKNGARVTSATAGSGRAGGVTVTADALSLLNRSTISSDTSGTGAGGGLTVLAGDTLVSGGSSISARSLTCTGTNCAAGGAAGSVTVVSDRLRLADNGSIASDTITKGNAGGISVVANELSIAGQARISSDSGVCANGTCVATGNAGAITVNAKAATLTTGGRISSSTAGSGNGGIVTIVADELALQSEAALQTVALKGSSGGAGTLNIDAGRLLAEGGSTISSSTLGAGDAGGVSVTAREIDLKSAASISSASAACPDGSCRATGNGGTVSLIAPVIRITDASVLSSTAGKGHAGKIAIAALDLSMSGGQIASNALAGSSGDAGTIGIDAGTLTVANGGAILSETASTGSAGAIKLAADETILTEGARISSSTSGAGDAGVVAVSGGSLSLQSGASMQSLALPGSSGAAGLVAVEVQNFLAETGASVSSSTFGSGDAGGVLIDAPKITLRSGASISSASAACEGGLCVATGDAGLVGLSGELIELTDGSITSSTAGSGSAGVITIAANLLKMSGGEIATRALEGSTGISGLIGIEANRVELADDAVVTSDTAGTGNAGGVSVKSPDIEITGGARLSSSTSSDGNAGFVVVDTQKLLVSNGGAILSETGAAGDAGLIAIVADTVRVEEGKIATSANFPSSGNAGQVGIVAARVDVRNGGKIVSDTSSTGNAGDVLINADEVNVANGARISSDSTLTCFSQPCAPDEDKGGDAGTVTINAKRVTLTGNPDSFTLISSDTYGAGKAGDVEVTATESLTVSNFGIMSSDTFGDGDAGSVTVKTGSLRVDEAQISSSAFQGSTGAGGAINIAAGSVSVLNGGEIISQAFSTGNAGSVSVVADRLVVSGADQFQSSRISSDTASSGRAGNILVNAGAVRLADGGSILSETAGKGDAGLIKIEAKELALDGGRIGTSAKAGSGGNAGEIDIAAPILELTNGSRISSDTASTGDAGFITVEADQVSVDASQIASSASETSSGNAGQIELSASTLTVRNGGLIASDTSASGNAGEISIKTDSLQLFSGGRISSDSLATCFDECVSGDAGNILIETRSLVMNAGPAAAAVSARLAAAPGTDGVSAASAPVRDSTISSNTAGNGLGGSIFIAADTIKVGPSAFITTDTSGAGRGGDLIVTAKSLDVTNGAGVAADSAFLCPLGGGCGNLGRAGNVLIDVDALRLVGGPNGNTFISSDALASGAAGNVEVLARTVLVDGGAFLTARALENSTGAAGFVGIIASESLKVGDGSVISSSTLGAGNAGGVLIETASLAVDGGRISSAADGPATGASGGLLLTVSGDTLLTNRGSLETTSSNSNPAGALALTTGNLVVDGVGSRISSGNTSRTGNAGSITIEQTSPGKASGILLNEGGLIATSAVNGAAGDIEIKMAPGTLLRLNGIGAPGAIDTSSGSNTGGRITIGAPRSDVAGNPFAIISTGGSITALGERGGANVLIETDFFIRSSDRANIVAVDGDFLLEASADDVSSGTSAREVSVIDASRVLRGQCPAARASGQLSQFSVRPVGPYAREAAPAPSSPNGKVTIGSSAKGADLQGGCS